MHVKVLCLILVMAAVFSGCAEQVASQRFIPSAGRQPKAGIFPGFEWARTNPSEDAILEHAAGTLLTAETLPRLLKCTTLSGVQNGVQVTLSYHPDQTVTVLRDGTVQTEGRWWMEGDLYCHNLGAAYGGRQCGVVLLNGNQVTWFDLEGFASMQFYFVER